VEKHINIPTYKLGTFILVHCNICNTFAVTHISVEDEKQRNFVISLKRPLSFAPEGGVPKCRLLLILSLK
jgi:hypothetical protein